MLDVVLIVCLGAGGDQAQAQTGSPLGVRAPMPGSILQQQAIGPRPYDHARHPAEDARVVFDTPQYGHQLKSGFAFGGTLGSTYPLPLQVGSSLQWRR